MTEQDEAAVVWAIAATFSSLLNGTLPLSKDTIERLLWYHLNPWCTEESFAFLRKVGEQVEEKQHE